MPPRPRKLAVAANFDGGGPGVLDDRSERRPDLRAIGQPPAGHEQAIDVERKLRFFALVAWLTAAIGSARDSESWARTGAATISNAAQHRKSEDQPGSNWWRHSARVKFASCRMSWGVSSYLSTAAAGFVILVGRRPARAWQRAIGPRELDAQFERFAAPLDRSIVCGPRDLERHDGRQLLEGRDLAAIHGHDHVAHLHAGFRGRPCWSVTRDDAPAAHRCGPATPRIAAVRSRGRNRRPTTRWPGSRFQSCGTR